MEDKNSNLSNQNLDNPSSRRKFLTRATIGAALATIPAKSVWATGLTNSIVASGHGSDFAGGRTLVLRSPDYWLTSNVPELNVPYSQLTYTSFPVIHRSLRRLFSSKEGLLLLRHLLGDRAQLENFIKFTLQGAVGNFKHGNKSYDIELGKKNGEAKRYTWEKFLEQLGGEEGVAELNTYLVSAYLNAKHSGFHGIHYPIVNGFNENYAPYQTAEQFLSKLHIAAASRPRDTLRTLKALHHDPSSLQHAT
jgi:hypothetical protein